jgi:hypothetical protein
VRRVENNGQNNGQRSQKAEYSRVDDQNQHIVALKNASVCPKRRQNFSFASGRRSDNSPRQCVNQPKRQNFSLASVRPVANNGQNNGQRSQKAEYSRVDGQNQHNFAPKGASILIFTAIFLICGLCAFAQEAEQARPRGKKVAVGLALEGWNFNSRENFSSGAALGFDIDIPYFIAMGAGCTASHDSGNLIVLEPAALFRWYVIGMKTQQHAGFFLQADGGAYLILEDEEVTPLFAGGLRIGYRQLMDSFYIEPYGRFGYPYVFGVGLSAGVKF